MLRELLSCFISRPYNVLRGGYADWTYSARCWRDRSSDPICARDRRWIDWVFRKVKGQENHCRIYYEEEIRRSSENLERHEATESAE